MEEKERPVIWHDENHYRYVRKRLLLYMALSFGLGLGFYAFCLYALALNERAAAPGEAVSISRLLTGGLYSEFLRQAVIASVIVAVVFFAILLVCSQSRLAANGVTFILYEGRLYRLTDANRGLTRLAGRTEEELSFFERDFSRAARSGGCWELLRVLELSENKNRNRIRCVVRRGMREQKEERKFDLYAGYPELDRLRKELLALKEQEVKGQARGGS